MAKRTRVKALEGRMIERVTIWPTDTDEGDHDFHGPTLEIRASGGVVFTFTATSRPQATAQLSYDRKGTLDLGDARKFE